MDITQSLKDTENSLRDFIAYHLEKSFGDRWVSNCGVSPERIKTWEERRQGHVKVFQLESNG